MSIKAMNWAMEQATGDPRAQCLLYVIADVANEEGIAWPGADWMAAKSQQSRATVYRRLDALQATGLLVTFPRWIDENGKIWNTASPGRRRTSPEIRLQFGVFIKQIEPEEEPETEAESIIPPSQPETGVSHSGDRPISVVRRGSSHYGDNKNHHLNQEESPQPPSGESVASPEGWKEFEADWSEPILRQSLARQVWSALKPGERTLARQAARGYMAWRRDQKKPPNVLGAHLFLKERDAWAKFAEYAPPERGTIPSAGLTADSREGRAILALHAIARAPQPFIGRQGMVYAGEITQQLLALSELPDKSEWIWIEGRAPITAWSEFLEAHVRSIHPALFNPMAVPYLWPPLKDGTWSSTGPPETLMTEEDMATEFK